VPDYPTYEGYRITKVTIIEPTLDTPATIIAARWQRAGEPRWCILSAGYALNRDGDWEYEPIPSSRDEDYRQRTGWATLDAAIDAVRRLQATG
jgi:hypothetical protein